MTEQEKKSLCSELEAKKRVFRQAKGLLKILLFTLCIEFVVFQFNSWEYIMLSSPFFVPDAFHNYVWYNTIIGIIVLINCIEMLYIKVAVFRLDRFLYIKFRHRVSGQDRLSMLWRMCDCHNLKKEEFLRIRYRKNFMRTYSAK